MQSFILRPWEWTDLESLVKHADNANIARYMRDGFAHPYTKECGERFIRFAKDHNPEGILAIDINGEAVGGIGVHPQTDIYRKNAELGYWLSEQYWGRGVVSRAISLMIQRAFEKYDIDRIYAIPFGSNKASQRVLEKNGFILEARLEKTIYKWGEYEDEWVYAIRRN